MDAFNNKDIIRSKLFEVPFVLTFSRYEIKGRKLNSLTIEQSTHVIIELLRIDCLKALKIIITIWLSRRKLAVYKIVIYRNRMWCQSMCSKLYG